MTSPEKKPVGVFDLARRDETGIHPEPEEGVFLSPWGTEGCQWDLDYSYLEDDDPPGESGQPEPTKP